MAAKTKDRQIAPGSANLGTLKALEAWKQQLEKSLMVMETLTEGAMKIRERQLKAAIEAHARAAAAHALVTRSGDQEQLFGAESEWIRDNLAQSAAYWNELFGAALETQANVVKCLCSSTPGGTERPTGA